MTRDSHSAGAKFHHAMSLENPLQIVGTINAYTALLAKHAGFQAIYLSGAGVANASYGLPDLGITTLHDVLEDVRRITGAVDLPLLVDADTGWGNDVGIGRTVKEMIKAGAAALHLEDQIPTKRCGHRQGKALVSNQEMCERLLAAANAKTDPHFILMARTDALAVEGLNAAIDRACQYVEAGADMLFFEGVNELSQYKTFVDICKVPVLANITEFGVTPLFTLDELAKTGVRLILYPLTAFRAMSATALNVYQILRHDKTQKKILDKMQTREELYKILNYYEHEKKLDQVLAKQKRK